MLVRNKTLARCLHRAALRDALDDAAVMEALSASAAGSAATGVDDLRPMWTLVYASDAHGLSFSRLIDAVGKSRGPTLIIVREQGPLQPSDPAAGDDPTSPQSASPADPTPSAGTGESQTTPSDPTPPGATADDDGDSHMRRVFGAYCADPWLTVRQRDEAATSNDAARNRAERTGYGHEFLHARPADQLPQFFGSGECFVFHADIHSCDATISAVPVGDGASGGAAVSGAHRLADPPLQLPSAIAFRAFRPRTGGSFKNSNFMYLFDTHFRRASIGLGMGCSTWGSPVSSPASATSARSSGGGTAFSPQDQRMAFFISNTATSATCSPTGCTTFDGLTHGLATAEDVRIGALEVWCADADALDTDRVDVSDWSVFDGSESLAALRARMSSAACAASPATASASATGEMGGEPGTASMPAQAGPDSVLRRETYGGDRFVLQMHGRKFYSDGV
jgi:hypothetical protein